MTIKAKQLYYLLVTLVVVLCVGFVGLGYTTNKLLEPEAKKLSKLKADSNVAQASQITLAKNERDIKKYSELNTIAQTVVPQDKDQAEAVREIVSIASQSGISKLSSITFPTSTLGTLTPGVVSNPDLTQLTPVTGINGVYSLQITVQQDASNRISYSQFVTFLEKLEQNRRTAQVSSITVEPDSQNTSQVAFTLVINEYIKP